MKKLLLFAVGAATLLVVGCRTTSMENLQSIPCAGREPGEVISAVEQVVESRNFQSRLAMRFGDRPIITVEDKSANSITLGWRVRKHYLRFRYDISGGVVTPKVLYSVNLKQDGDRIHRRAVEWINDLAPDLAAAIASTPREEE